MDRFDALDVSAEEFDWRFARVSDDDWQRPTPCTGWTVRDLVNHLVGGSVRYAMLLDGATVEEVERQRTLDHLGNDPLTAYRATAASVTSAFRQPGALTRTVDHRAGTRSGEQLLIMRLLECTVHAWDLARGVGLEETLDPDLVDLVWRGMPSIGMASGGRASAFSPPVDDAEDLPVQDRLLRLTGRRP